MAAAHSLVDQPVARPIEAAGWSSRVSPGVMGSAALAGTSPCLFQRKRPQPRLLVPAGERQVAVRRECDVGLSRGSRGQALGDAGPGERGQGSIGTRQRFPTVPDDPSKKTGVRPATRGSDPA